MEIGLKYFDGSKIIEIPVSSEYSDSKLRVAKNGVVYGISLVDPDSVGALPIRIKLGTEIKAIGTGYYELNYLGRKYSSFGGVPWYDLILNGNLVNTDSDVIYSTTSGNWTPFPASNKELRLNVDGLKNTGGADPRSGFKVMYRVFESFKVSVQSKTWGNHGQVKLDRTDTFQRQSYTSILINGSPQTIAIGSYYQMQRVDWNPGDNGSGYSWLRVYNRANGYFDVNIEVWEYDEENDSAWVQIDSYIEVAV